jgi:hypothetical protein
MLKVAPTLKGVRIRYSFLLPRRDIDGYNKTPSKYPGTLANSILIILFAEMLKFSKKNYFFQIKKNCEGKSGIFHLYIE